MEKLIVCEPTSGLASRIYVLADAYALAKENHQKLIVLWRKTADCDCRYSDVFATEQFSDISFHIYECNQYSARFEDLKKQHTFYGFEKMIQETWVRLTYYCKHTALYHYYRSRCKIYKNSYLDHNELFKPERAKNRSCFFEAYNCITGQGNLRDIKFRSKYLHEAEHILEPAGQNVIGVHIRRTDHGLAKQSKTEHFINRMEEEIQNNPSVCFFLATDDWDEQNRMEKRFGSRILTQQYKTLERSSRAGMHSSIIDLICLSKTTRIMGSNSSIFSKFAAEYGNIPLEII